MIVSIIEPESKRLLARLMFTSPSRSARHFIWRIYKQLRGPQGGGLILYQPATNADARQNRRQANRVAHMLFNQQACLDIACDDAEYEVIKSLPRHPG